LAFINTDEIQAAIKRTSLPRMCFHEYSKKIMIGDLGGIKMKSKNIANKLIWLFFMVLLASFMFSQDTVSSSKVWYASLLKGYFPNGLSIHGINYSLNSLPCLPKDITKFNITAGKTDIGFGSAFEVKGSLKLGKIMEPFSVMDGAKGKKYMLLLQAYLFSASGQILWQQQGFPIGNSWVSADGGSAEFRLINAFSGSTRGCVLLIIAAGDPVMSDYDEWRVIIGVKRINLK